MRCRIPSGGAPARRFICCAPVPWSSCPSIPRNWAERCCATAHNPKSSAALTRSRAPNPSGARTISIVCWENGADAMNITIYHNPGCGTSRNTLAAIRAAGHEPVIVEYLKTPPTRDELKSLIARMGIRVRAVVRTKEALFRELGLDELDVGD